MLCGRQYIPLRGHRDDSTSSTENKGNFLAVLQEIAKHDVALNEHLLHCHKNAKYTSKTIQNEMIEIVADHIKNEITKSLRGSGNYFSIIADEVTDHYSNQEILCLCLRFFDVNSGTPIIREFFLDFAFLERTTGEQIASFIIDRIKVCEIDITNARGQAYDGASNMLSEQKGTCGNVAPQLPNGARLNWCCTNSKGVGTCQLGALSVINAQC